MERDGVKVDREVLKSLSAEFNSQIAALEEQICGEAGCKFTIGSPQQLGDILFNQMGLSGGRKGKSGTWSTDVTELERLSREGVPIAQLVLDWRQLTKLKIHLYRRAAGADQPGDRPRPHQLQPVGRADRAARLDRPQPHEHPDPHRDRPAHPRRLHRRAGPCHARPPTTARSSCASPPISATCRSCSEAFAAGADIHNMTAQELFGEVNRDTRASAKTINFAILYGISRWGLARRLGVTADEAQAIIDRYFERFPGIRDYIADTLTDVRETGFTTTLFGRKTHFPRIKSKSSTSARAPSAPRSTRRSRAPRADIIKRAMARMGPALAGDGLSGTRMLLQVHDELVFEVPEADVDGAARGHPRRHGGRRRAGDAAQRAAGRRDRHRAELGRRALSEAPARARRGHRRAGEGRPDQFLRLPAAARRAPALPVHRRPLLRRRSCSAASLMR